MLLVQPSKIHRYAANYAIGCFADVGELVGQRVGSEFPDAEFANNLAPVLHGRVPLRRERDVPKLLEAGLVHRRSIIKDCQRGVRQ